MYKFLTVEEVAAINALVIDKTSPAEQKGIKSYELLESAVFGPQQSAFGRNAYSSIESRAAAFFESLVKNHAFYNANKRTAFIALNIFLKRNGFDLRMDPKFAEDFTVDVVNHKYTLKEIELILVKYTQKRT